ncbi:MAG TPA: His/Gly/Thr/Pro-type tRNA ligase C-terminal domain-containing protein [Solirubrobacterales bacterium]|nr:His/Gly/Thr/Pro-type tRNA ligase C-terminal domain-containing protein [Solirubrobacterales bacterium]
MRAAELGRFPYMLVVGDREMEAGEVSVRSHEDGELGSMAVEKFCMLLDS